MALDLQRTENGIVNQLICMNRLIPPRSRRKRSPRKKSHKCKGCPYNFSTNIYTLERLQHLQPQINSRPAPSSYHSLINIHINTFYYTLCYSIKSKKLLLEECKEMTHTPHSVKFLSLGPLHCSILQQNTDFLEVLYRITGGNVKALDDFTQLLAKIVAPVPKYPSLAVVFTKKCKSSSPFLPSTLPSKVQRSWFCHSHPSTGSRSRDSSASSPRRYARSFE